MDEKRVKRVLSNPFLSSLSGEHLEKFFNELTVKNPLTEEKHSNLTLPRVRRLYDKVQEEAEQVDRIKLELSQKFADDDMQRRLIDKIIILEDAKLYAEKAGLVNSAADQARRPRP